MKSFKGEIQDRKRPNWHRSFSVLFAVLMFIGILSFAGSAQNNNRVKMITSFEMSLIEVTVSPGTLRGDLPLPETLAATLEGGSVTNIPVTWEDADLYNENLLGKYVFSADIGTYIYGEARPVAVVSVELSEEATQSDADPLPETVHSIGGKIWIDENSDGVMDETENGAADYPVSLYRADNMDEAVQTTQTQEDGSYLFENVGSGEYIVSIIPEIVRGREYRLPFVGISGDNKFKLIELDETALAAHSEVYELSGNESMRVENVNAGVFGIPNTRAGTVWSVGTFAQLKTSLQQSRSGDIIQITASIIFSESLDITKSLTFRPTPGQKFALIQKNGRHFYVKFNNNSETKVTFENLIVDGGGLGGGIDVKLGNYLTLDLYNTTIQNCYARAGAAIQFGNLKSESDDISRGNSDSVANGGILTVNGGKFIKNDAPGEGGAIFVDDCYLNLNGSVFLNNISKGNGGAINVNEGSVFLMEGVELSENRTTEGFGGSLAIFYSDATIINSKFSQNRGMIEDDDGFGVGGGMYGFISNIEIKDSEFKENRGSVGAGVVAYDTKLVVENTNFINNTATMYGGAVASYSLGGGAVKANVSIKGGEITGNRSEIDGGAIYIFNISSEKHSLIIDGCSISNNAADLYGGAIQAERAEISLKNSYLSGNTAKYGGGVYSLGSSGLTLDGGGISNNRARAVSGNPQGGLGGGIYTSGGSSVLVKNNGVISDNTAEYVAGTSGRGGGVYVSGSQLTIERGNITGNIGSQLGGGVYSDGRASVKIHAGEISGNKSPNGGGIYTESLANLSVTSQSVVFRDNLAATANNRDDVDMVLHDQMIHTTHFTTPFDFAYSNYDVGYTKTATGVFYTVIFDSQGGDAVPSKLIAAGTTVAEPTPEPARSGYIFGGWYKEASCENLWNFTSDTVLSDITLYAKWGQGIEVAVSKTVEGEYGNKTKDFAFKIRILDENGNGFPAGTLFPYTGSVLSGTNAAPADGALTLDGNSEAVFSLRHGQQITITGINMNHKVQIVETDAEGYTVSFNDGTNTSTGADTGVYTLNASKTFSFVNTRQEVVPAGVLTGNIKGSILLILAALMLAVLAGGFHVYHRRKGEK